MTRKKDVAETQTSNTVHGLLKLLGFDLSILNVANNKALLTTICSYYNTVFLHMPQNVYWLDVEGHGLGCNQNVLDTFGLSSIDEFVGLDFEAMAELAHWDLETMEGFKRDTLEVIATGKPKMNIEEPPILDSKGELVHFLTTRVPIANEEGKVVSVVGISSDITERKLAEKELQDTLHELKAANEIKSEFIANMSHDIRTPITGMLGMSHFIEQNSVEPEIKEYANLLVGATNELLSLLNAILDTANIDMDEIQKKPKFFNLNSLIEHNVKLLRPTIVDKN